MPFDESRKKHAQKIIAYLSNPPDTLRAVPGVELLLPHISTVLGLIMENKGDIVSFLIQVGAQTARQGFGTSMLHFLSDERFSATGQYSTLTPQELIIFSLLTPLRQGDAPTCSVNSIINVLTLTNPVVIARFYAQLLLVDTLQLHSTTIQLPKVFDKSLMTVPLVGDTANPVPIFGVMTEFTQPLETLADVLLVLTVREARSIALEKRQFTNPQLFLFDAVEHLFFGRSAIDLYREPTMTAIKSVRIKFADGTVVEVPLFTVRQISDFIKKVRTITDDNYIRVFSQSGTVGFPHGTNGHLETLNIYQLEKGLRIGLYSYIIIGDSNNNLASHPETIAMIRVGIFIYAFVKLQFICGEDIMEGTKSAYALPITAAIAESTSQAEPDK
ncbi:MAG: hypothetical protein LBB38_02535 [Puniceicoccales bacterium]|nr:hypothetical protein [Puniceicoccales bacterium]